MACECRQWVYCLTPNLAQLGKGGLAPKAPKCEYLVEIAIYWRFSLCRGDTRNRSRWNL